MKKSLFPHFIKIRILPVLLPLLLTPRCFGYVTKTRQNYSGVREWSKVSFLRQSGFRFWIDGGEAEPVDELRLVPGEYIIGFARSYNQTRGAALCQLDPGKVYSFKVTGRQYLPKSGRWAYLGVCFFEPERKENRTGKLIGGPEK